MGLQCGIVGLPNVGKSTLFNCLSNAKAQSANFPFCTIEPNVGVITVPDERLNKLVEIDKPASVVPAVVEIVDIAGWVKGASKGEGLGNKFLSNIRETDAIIHVLRCFEDSNIVHVDGSVDPVRDKEIIDTELQLKDLETVESRLQKEEKSENTIDKYLRDVRAFMKYAGQSKIVKETVIAYKTQLIQKNYAAHSINSMLASINCLFAFLGWSDNKVKSIKLQRQIYCPEEKELTKAEYMRLVNTANSRGNERLSLILQTICGTGIRVSELPFITVESVKAGEATVSLKGKMRSVFIVRDLQKKLLSYATEQNIKTGTIFITRTGKPMSRTNIWREMKNLCVQAHVNPEKVFPHNLRHLFARTFYGIEKDIAKLADILGHSSINTTRIYIITTGNEHRRRMENMKLIL